MWSTSLQFITAHSLLNMLVEENLTHTFDSCSHGLAGDTLNSFNLLRISLEGGKEVFPAPASVFKSLPRTVNVFFTELYFILFANVLAAEYLIWKSTKSFILVKLSQQL